MGPQYNHFQSDLLIKTNNKETAVNFVIKQCRFSWERYFTNGTIIQKSLPPVVTCITPKGRVGISIWGKRQSFQYPGPRQFRGFLDALLNLALFKF